MKIFIMLLGILIIGCNSAEMESDNQESEKIIQEKSDQKSKETVLQDGDLIFHTSESNQSQAIQIVTKSKYSHMGIIFKEENEFFVYEAVQPVKITKLKDWISRGKESKYVVKRLKNSAEVLTEEGIAKMKSIGKKYLGKDYDFRFEWSDDKIYCSELVWKIYKEAFNIEIGKLQKIGDFDLSDETVQKKVKERYGDKAPKEELVITPDRMFKAKDLIQVLEK